MLGIKEEGRFVDLDHIVEKVSRDSGATPQEISEALRSLVISGLVEERGARYSITDRGREVLDERLKLPEVASRLNRSYRLVYIARKYYDAVGEYMLPFLRDRAVSVVKVFSSEEDPINQVKPLFVRWARYKPTKIPITIESKEKLMELVHDHAVDFIPYVHKLNSNEPDWFVLDLDAGEKLKKHPKLLDMMKAVAKAAYLVLEDYGIRSSLKFSGSRGIQIWAKFQKPSFRVEDMFKLYRDCAVYLQRKIEEKLRKMPEGKIFDEIWQKGISATTSRVHDKESRAEQILVDWSVMKPMGDVRAPFSIHYKTGLVSVPLNPSKLDEFDPIRDADPFRVAKRADELSGYFELEECDAEELLREAMTSARFGGKQMTLDMLWG